MALLLGRLGLDCPAAIQTYKDLASSVVGIIESESWKRVLKISELDMTPYESAYDQALQKVASRYGEDGKCLMLPADASTLTTQGTSKVREIFLAA